MNLDQDFHFQVNVYDMMTPKEKKIALYFSKFYVVSESKKMKKVYPGQDKICEKVGCSRSTITRFLSKFSFLFKITQDRLFPTSVWRNNIYKLNRFFFEVVAWLKYKKLILPTGELSRNFVREANDNQELVMKKIGFFFGVVNNTMTHGGAEKRRTNSYKSRDIVPPSAIQPSAVPFSDCLREIRGLGRKALHFITRFGSRYAVQQTVEDYVFNLKKNNPIRYLDAWFISRLKAHLQKQYTFVNC